MLVTNFFLPSSASKWRHKNDIENDVILVLILRNELNTKPSALYLHLRIPHKLPSAQFQLNYFDYIAEYI